jgi:hypothetical protein
MKLSANCWSSSAKLPEVLLSAMNSCAHHQSESKACGAQAEQSTKMHSSLSKTQMEEVRGLKTSAHRQREQPKHAEAIVVLHDNDVARGREVLAAVEAKLIAITNDVACMIHLSKMDDLRGKRKANKKGWPPRHTELRTAAVDPEHHGKATRRRGGARHIHVEVEAVWVVRAGRDRWGKNRDKRAMLSPDDHSPFQCRQIVYEERLKTLPSSPIMICFSVWNWGQIYRRLELRVGGWG